MSDAVDQPVTRRRIVRLEPLRRDHLDGVAEVAFDPSLWQWTLARPVDRPASRHGCRPRSTMPRLDRAPFATVERASGRAIGSTASEHRGGAPPVRDRLDVDRGLVQRTGANREAKLLQLEHGFERLGANRIEFKTDSLNEKSRTARCSGSVRHSRGSSATTWSCPMGAFGIPRTTASPARTGPR